LIRHHDRLHRNSLLGHLSLWLKCCSDEKPTAIGYHTHPGDEAGYVLQGFLILKVREQPDRTLNAGDSFFIPLGAVHSLAATPGEDGGIAVSTWIINKGKPLATTVP
jgi:quercetin dioxygenase-like cupin family protein